MKHIPEKDRCRIGIMGTGWVAKMRHIPAYRRDKRCAIVGLYNSNKELVNQAEKEFGIPGYSDIDIFLALPTEIVSICTPPKTHFALAQKALLAGKHVLLEKPMTMTAEEGKILEALAKERGLLLSPSHNFLFCRATKKADQLLQNGKIGQITSVMGMQWSSWKRKLPAWYPELPGGLFFDEAPHLFYLVDHFLEKAHIVDAWRTTKKLSGSPSFERYEIRLEGKMGQGTISAWFGAPMSEWFVVVSGTNGSMILDIFRDQCIYFKKEETRTPKYLIDVVLHAEKQFWSGIIRWFWERYTIGSHLFGIDEVISKFISSYLNKTPLPVEPENGYRVINMIEQTLEKTKYEDRKTETSCDIHPNS